jgi:lysophospholipase L1-like esterase
MNYYTWLALGDSYTIGESVPVYDNFCYQATQQLRKDGFNFQAPEIVARTGWTTEELHAAIERTQLLPAYDFVSLLIGVNNQFRGNPLDGYKVEFEKLLKRAIQFAGGKSTRVIVLSIPDWGATPFSGGRDPEKIASEIDEFNNANRAIADNHNVFYIDVTPYSREATHNSDLVASDGLHPSGEEYTRWANKIVAIIKTELSS